ncbi:acyl-homoserine-lactone synthase [Bosea sp. (in: a-proteobacteria)]|uniref:acyl-homoserine-lactone synthase n=1 Tax=Bosea sp. (in: a-proteobacteria) TaxID=1871050 RepID=UPI00273584BF|nr:acyl-homoserine-lactone synthase [Bosea sp. (in: a-proteobacteria)]
MTLTTLTLETAKSLTQIKVCSCDRRRPLLKSQPEQRHDLGCSFRTLVRESRRRPARSPPPEKAMELCAHTTWAGSVRNSAFFIAEGFNMLMVIHGSDVGRHSALMNRAHRFRHSIFVDEKGWEELRQSDGCERDRFDDAHAVHHICLHGEEIVGYQRLLPTTRPHLLTDVLTDLCRRAPPRGPRVFEWTRFCVAQGHRELRPRGNSPFLELAQGVVEWGMARRVGTVTVAIDWRLMVIAMQLRFFVRPLGFPQRIGRDEVVALSMSFNRETLAAIQAARGCTDPVLPSTHWPSAA